MADDDWVDRQADILAKNKKRAPKESDVEYNYNLMQRILKFRDKYGHPEGTPEWQNAPAQGGKSMLPPPGDIADIIQKGGTGHGPTEHQFSDDELMYSQEYYKPVGQGV